VIDGAVVIEGVCHGVDLREENWRNPTVCPAFRDFGYFALTTAVPPDEPRWALSRERFLEGATADPDVVAGVVFHESVNDALVYHGVPLFGLFAEGLSPMRIGLELRERFPGKVWLYGPVSPFEPDALEEIDRLVEEEQVVGIKLYPVDLYGDDLKSYRMCDPDLIFPLIERARDRGLKVVAIHKAIPLGPLPLAPMKVDDVDEVALAFPGMTIEVVHGGFAFLEETMFLLARFPNVTVNLEGTANFLARQPRKFAEVMAAFLAVHGEDRIIWGTGAAGFHCQPLIERFWRFEIPDDLLEYYDAPPLTAEIKRKILGENLARVIDIDLDRLRESSPRAGEELAAPWSG
jgi:uncharacterized protein